MAATQMTDESGQAYPSTVNTLLDRALGPEGYYGAYTVNAHTDVPWIIEAETVVGSAQARGVPIVSAQQMLTWLDARNASSFSNINYSGGSLSFTVVKDPAANGLQAMLPARNGGLVLSALTQGGSGVSFTLDTIKGVEYALFTASGGTYVATYAADNAAPQVVSTTPAANATGVAVTARPTAVFNEAMDPATIGPATFELRDAANALVSASVVYAASSRSAILVPTAALAPATTYVATLRGGANEPRIKDAAGNPLAASFTWSFTTAAGPECPCGVWGPAAVPGTPSVADPNPVELGVKFSSDINGFVSGIRFYKGTGNTGTHVGNLWTAGGAQLATAVFTDETASGWQQVNFTTPVPITAGTVYVASYFAPNGNYAADYDFFASNSAYNAPIRLLQDGTSGGNGVYAYGGASSFPTSTFRSSNYWVDVVFTTVGPADNTPPTVTGSVPVNGVTGIGIGSAATATFSEPVDANTVNASTVGLLGPGGTSVAGAVAYDQVTRTATFTPSAALSPSTSYSLVVKGGAADPRIKDIAGNALAADFTATFTTGGLGGSCAAPGNAIVAENCLPGNPASEWDVSGRGDLSIQGFATDISVNRGGTVSFKVDTTASSFRFDIYRMGYYGGLGARKVATVQATNPQSQPSCLNDPTTGLIDCGNWSVSG